MGSNESLSELLQQMHKQFYEFNCAQGNKILEIIKTEVLSNENIKEIQLNILDLAKENLLSTITIKRDRSVQEILEKLNNFITDDNNNIPNSSNTIKYYWIQYKEGEQTKKISLFAKIYDNNTTNMHVLPGVREDWVLNKDSENPQPYRYEATNESVDEYENINGLISGDKDKGQFLVAELLDDELWIPMVQQKTEYLSVTEINKKKTITKGKNYYLCSEMERIHAVFGQLIVKIKSANHCGIWSRISNGKRLYENYGFIWNNFTLQNPKMITAMKGALFPYTIYNHNSMGCFYKYGEFMMKFDDNKQIMSAYYHSDYVTIIPKKVKIEDSSLSINYMFCPYLTRKNCLNEFSVLYKYYSELGNQFFNGFIPSNLTE